jgi:hypothetical protein
VIGGDASMMANSVVKAVAGLLCVASAAALALAQVEPVPNPSFEQGTDAPDGWALSEGTGAWQAGGRTGARCVSVTGTGEDSSYWMCDEYRLAPSAGASSPAPTS